MQGNGYILTGMGEPERLVGWNVSANLFSMLGAPPAIGREFRPEEDVVGANGAAIISHALWQRRFGADPSVIGKAVQLNSRRTQ